MKRQLINLILIFFLAGLLSGDVDVKKNKDGSITVTHKQKKAHIIYAYKKPKYNLNSSQFTSRYALKVKNYARMYNFREDVALAVAKVESDFNPTAVSKKGAVGIMQLMKETARDYGVKNRYNPDQNIKAGIKHLKYLYKKYKGNLDLTLAGYNAGETAVKKYKGVPPYRETKNYIKKIRKLLGAGLNLLSLRNTKTRLYQYKTADGRIVITDRLPANRENINIIE